MGKVGGHPLTPPVYSLLVNLGRSLKPRVRKGDRQCCHPGGRTPIENAPIPRIDAKWNRKLVGLCLKKLLA